MIAATGGGTGLGLLKYCERKVLISEPQVLRCIT